MLILLFAADVAKVFPVGGYGSGFGGHLESLFLPALTIAIGLAPLLSAACARASSRCSSPTTSRRRARRACRSGGCSSATRCATP